MQVTEHVSVSLLADAAAKDPTQDILAAAFLGDEELDEHQYSGTLIYQAKTKRIMTMNEYEGVKTTTGTTANYFVKTEEEHTLTGITPARTWLSITLVFPKTPTREVAYNSMFTEIEKVAN